MIFSSLRLGRESPSGDRNYQADLPSICLFSWSGTSWKETAKAMCTDARRQAWAFLQGARGPAWMEAATHQPAARHTRGLS